MSLSLVEIRSMCTKAEYDLIAASRTPSIEKLSVAELKKNSANARKLAEKWQKLSRGQSRSEARKTGEPNLGSRSNAKHQAIHDAVVAYESRLATASATTTVQAAAKKLTPKQRTASARVSRQAARTDLQGVKKTLNKAAKAVAPKTAKAKAPAVKVVATKPVAKPAASKSATKTAAAKKTLVKTAAKRTAKRAAVASTSTVVPAAKKVVKATAKTGVVAPTSAAKAQLAGKAKANRMKLSNLSSNIAGHVSGQGKRVQAKRDSKGR